MPFLARVGQNAKENLMSLQSPYTKENPPTPKESPKLVTTKTYVFGSSDPFLSHSALDGGLVTCSSFNDSSIISPPLSSVPDIPLSSEGDDENNPFLVTRHSNRGIKRSDLSPAGCSKNKVSAVALGKRSIRFLNEIFLTSSSTHCDNAPQPIDVTITSTTPAEILEQIAKRVVAESIASSNMKTDSDLLMQQDSTRFQLEDWIDLRILSEHRE